MLPIRRVKMPKDSGIPDFQNLLYQFSEELFISGKLKHCYPNHYGHNSENWSIKFQRVPESGLFCELVDMLKTNNIINSAI